MASRTSPGDGLRWFTLSPALGARVELDLSEVIASQRRDELRSLLLHHHLLYVEASNDLSEDDQLRFARLFGTVIPSSPDGGDVVYVSNSRADGYLGRTKLEWHSDISFAPVPYSAGCLYGLDVEDGRSSTRFASAARAYETLPDDLRKGVNHLQVVNSITAARESGDGLAGGAWDRPAAVHRIVSEHPMSGALFLSVNALHSDSVVGIDREASRALLDTLFEYLYSPDNVYEHSWRRGDLLIWDNRIVQHSRGDVSGVGPRTLRRITLGSATFAEQFPEAFAAVVGTERNAPA